MQYAMMIGFPGTMELIVICGIIFLLFGASFFPKFMRGMGEGVREFRKIGKEVEGAVKELEREENKEKETSI
jgi:sec-independent protein translocase protein TatA